MKMTKLSLVAAFAVSSAFAGGDIAPVEVVETPVVEESAFTASANMAITSNYIWRGQTQTSNAPAIQGGIDLGYNGFYLGTWLSNVDFNLATDNSLEADFYAGYASELAGIGFDIGYIQYTFPNSSSVITDNLEEVYVGLSKDFGGFGINGKYSFALDDTLFTDYWEVGASAELPMDFGLSAAYGEQDDWGTNYIVSLSKTWGKFEFSVAYTDFSSDIVGLADEDNVVGTISTSF